jgi:hypothetical protein
MGLLKINYLRVARTWEEDIFFFVREKKKLVLCETVKRRRSAIS